jgi:hypothetical protein
MIVRKATDADLVHVLDHLCDMHQEEMKVAKLDRGLALAHFRRNMFRGVTEVAIVDGEPSCLFGLVLHNGHAGVWFIAHRKFFTLGSSAVRYGREYLRRTADRYGPLYAATSSGGQKVERWLRVLGFTPTVENGGFQNWRYNAG